MLLFYLLLSRRIRQRRIGGILDFPTSLCFGENRELIAGWFEIGYELKHGYNSYRGTVPYKA